MRLTQEQINELINALQGSCSSINEQLQMRWDVDVEELDNEMEVLLAIDEEIFCCSTCNWWCPMSEETATPQGESEFGCSDCFPEEEEND